ncbi:MAG: hypothetical protein P0107_02400 [Nitrosomonas sp.]|nr:hypothetical protein [Nitrosomonas sp.]
MTGSMSFAAINLWRCLVTWLGGMRLIVLAVAILPMLGVGAGSSSAPKSRADKKVN